MCQLISVRASYSLSVPVVARAARSPLPLWVDSRVDAFGSARMLSGPVARCWRGTYGVKLLVGLIEQAGTSAR